MTGGGFWGGQVRSIRAERLLLGASFVAWPCALSLDDRVGEYYLEYYVYEDAVFVEA